MKKVKIQANRKFYDTVEQRHIKKNSVYIVDFERAEEIAKHPKDLITVLEVFEDVKIKPQLPNLTFVNEGNGMIVKTDDYLELEIKKLPELKQLAKERNIKVTGLKKAEIIEKLIETK